MSIVPFDLPMTSRRLESCLLALQETYPPLNVIQLTTTAFQRPLWALRLGDGPRQVLYTAAHHGNEWITAPLLLRFVEELAAAASVDGKIYGVPTSTILKYATLHFVPMVDPDGVDLVTGAIGPDTQPYLDAQRLARHYPKIPFPEGWKANLLGVDLNLQYPAGWLQAREIKFSQGYTRPGPRDYVGRYPLSQRETQALAEYTDRIQPDLVLAYHTQGRVIYWQFRDIHVPGARELGEEFARLSGYALSDTPYASSFAGFKDWFIQTYRRPGFTVEAGAGANPLPLSQLPEMYRENLGILVTAATGLPAGS